VAIVIILYHLNLYHFSVLMGWMQQGACVIQPSSMLFGADELASMIQHCGLTHLAQFAAFLAAKLREAKSNDKLMSLLSSLDDVVYSGMPLAPEEEDWAYRNGISVRVSAFLAYDCVII
jgi:acyl-coenzyme A synthetase/AMP-(fatty) acid ligase